MNSQKEVLDKNRGSSRDFDEVAPLKEKPKFIVGAERKEGDHRGPRPRTGKWNAGFGFSGNGGGKGPSGHIQRPTERQNDRPFLKRS